MIVRTGPGLARLEAHLGRYAGTVHSALDVLASERTLPRIWARDHTVWKPDPKDIANRLGWLDVPLRMRESAPQLQAFAGEIEAAGLTQAVLLGMGGSSLAPELYSRVFGQDASTRPHLNLQVLDSTDPAAVLSLARCLDPERTLFIVSTKSGGTVETLSTFKYFYNWTAATVGFGRTGAHFVAITDPGSDLARMADRLRFRATFLSDPSVGGRFSAFSLFGLVPAALCGVDLPRLLERAVAEMDACGPQLVPQDNPAASLGAALGELAMAGRDKLTLIASAEIASFGDWVEQLIAESTGKDGRGILPVVGEPPVAPSLYAADRVFVHVQLCGPATGGDRPEAALLAALQGAGHPVIELYLRDKYDLAGQFYLWEFATAVAGQRLGVNPFDQPNVETAKVCAREMMAAYSKTGALPFDPPRVSGDGVAVYGAVDAASPAAALMAFLKQGRPGDYVAVHAYLQPDEKTDAALRSLRLRLLEKYRLATTVGYGPRYLHSTGQLHKGDAGRGLFVQLTADDAQDAPIPNEPGSPDSSITFGLLKAAQALGDRRALLDAGRRVIRLHLGGELAGGVGRLTSWLG